MEKEILELINKHTEILNSHAEAINGLTDQVSKLSTALNNTFDILIGKK